LIFKASLLLAGPEASMRSGNSLPRAPSRRA